ncbi:MATE family efflux transporter [Vallitalea okinawensis]|uniref:MATE family efflux transporter n=1 Tax=Vallitalea okinawensis TaxID=2078660 RepID=UPI000CFBA69F|nr:MATE family efflux transporter [Vallitalea okinawensis]
MRILKDKNYIRTILNIAIPISLQSLIQASLNMIDQFMIGQLGETSIAAVGLGSKFSFILFLSLGGITSAASIFTAQFWGKQSTKHIGQIIGSTLLLGTLITTLFTLLSLIAPQTIMGIFSQDQYVIVQGSSYMKIISIGFFPMFLVMTYSSVLRSTENARLPMYIGLLSVLLNTALNYILIFGRFGLPQLGVRGAALATTISRVIECTVLITIMYIRKYPCAVPVREMCISSKDLIKSFLVTTCPLLLNEGIWAVGDSMFSVIYGRMGTNEVAAMTITYPIQSLCIAFFVGLGSATGIILGKELGANRNDIAFEYSKKFIRIGIMGSLIVGLLIMLFSSLYVNAFNVSQEVKEHGIKILIIFGIILFVKVSNMIVSGGILRSGGRTKLTLYLELLGIWGIGVPLGFIAAFVFKLPIHIVYLVIAIEEIVRLLIGLKLTYSKKWMKNLVNNVI